MHINQQLQQLIDAGQASFLIIKDDILVYQDLGIGVKPIIKVINSNPDLITDAIIIDKVIGKAAAMLLIKFKAQAVHGLLMSETALKLLDRHGLKYQYDNLVPYIANRNNDGLCPLEDSVKDTDDLDQGYSNILARISELMKAK